MALAIPSNRHPRFRPAISRKQYFRKARPRVADIPQSAFTVDSEHQSSEVVHAAAWFSDATDHGFLLHSGLVSEPIFRPAPGKYRLSFRFAMIPSRPHYRPAWKNSVPRPFMASLNRMDPSFGKSFFKISRLPTRGSPIKSSLLKTAGRVS